MDCTNKSDSLHKQLNTKLAKSNNSYGIVETIREHTDTLLYQAGTLYDLDYINEEEYKILMYACEKHDYGKINDFMQKRLNRVAIKFNENKEVQHNILSALFMHIDDLHDEEDYIVALYAVLYHHRNFCGNETQATLLRYSNSLIDQFAEKYEDFVLDEGERKKQKQLLRKIDKLMAKRDSDILSEDRVLINKLIKMKGLLHKCDYSASAHIDCELKNDFMEKHLQKLPEQWNKPWNDLQCFSIENSDRNMLVTAPTGSGKTEAALLWAGNNKTFFVLPLITAINAMYERIKSIVNDNEHIDNKVALLHSDMKAYYMNDGDDFGTEELFSYILKSKQMSLPVTVSTLDQIFDFGLKYYGYEFKLATLSYSKVIIDEIQMYSPELLAYLIYGVKKIIEFGGKVAVLTATLPPFAKIKLLEVMGQNVALGDYSALKEDRHNIKVSERKLSAKDIINVWKKRYTQESRKFLVICNCIETATRIYKELREELCDDEVEINLLHSQFTRKDRCFKESKILEAGTTFNKEGKIHKLHQIWVTTSVVEASLDIDFDVLFTELLDIFSLFQRLGRVNRKGYKDIGEVNCFVYTELQDGPARNFNKGGETYKFVDETIYNLSKEAVMTIDGILSEEEKKKLINNYLSADKIENSKYGLKYKETIKELENTYNEEYKNKGIRAIDNIDIIPRCVYLEHREEIDDCERIVNDRSENALSILQAMENVKNHMVSVNVHRVFGKMSPYDNKKDTQKNVIKLGKHYSLPIVDCDYDDEVGIGKIYKHEEKSESRFI